MKSELRKLHRKVFLAISLIFGNELKAIPKKNISYSDIQHHMVSPTRGIFAVTTSNEEVFFLSADSQYLYKSKYTATLPKWSEKAFGVDFTTSKVEKIKVSEPFNSVDWRGLSFFDENTVLGLESKKSRILGYSTSKGGFLSSGDIILDLIIPAPDSRGSATASETRQMRRRFNRELSQSEKRGYPLAGLANFPRTLQERVSEPMLLLTRVTGFPFLTMNCDDELQTRCQAKKACFVEGLSDYDNQGFLGLGIATDGTLVIGDRRLNQILVLQFSSCYHISMTRILVLPEKIPELANLHIDEHDNLWVSTVVADNYKNASLFVFRPEIWRK